MFQPRDAQPCAGSKCSQGFPGPEMVRPWRVQQSCVSSSRFLLYRWDFEWDFASERQAAALGGEEGSAGAACGQQWSVCSQAKIRLLRETK